MSSQIPTSLASSPRKRGSKLKGKQCSLNGNNTSHSVKAQCTKGDHTSVSSKSAMVEHHDEYQTVTQEPRRSGRAGTGLGWRTHQLQKIGAILEGHSTRSCQSTNLPEDITTNPLAPLVKSAKSVWRGISKNSSLEVSSLTVSFFASIWRCLHRTPLHLTYWQSEVKSKWAQL